MLSKRIVVCLDVDHGRVVKGVRFRDLRDVGDPAVLAERYEAESADEVVLLDISATVEGRSTLLETVRRTAERLFVPLTVGGGIGSVENAARALRAGADKVAVNTAAVLRPELLTEVAERFGAQCAVVSIDARRDATAPSGYRVFTRGGRGASALDAVEWAARAAELGAGEVLLTSIDQDGVRSGFDAELTRRVADAVPVPVIASGGAGRAEHFADVLGVADAALAAGIFHDGIVSVAQVKCALDRAGLPVRGAGTA
ncbi:MAG TPA: imidazole glycerol phosphate synthase subunit HisF [Longimicrobiaceae bacterium]|nr:imidazole glycerol phosphate synthase subunit HisF [Longimicrobiaceae bacterium]